MVLVEVMVVTTMNDDNDDNNNDKYPRQATGYHVNIYFNLREHAPDSILDLESPWKCKHLATFTQSILPRERFFVYISIIDTKRTLRTFPVLWSHKLSLKAHSGFD